MNEQKTAQERPKEQDQGEAALLSFSPSFNEAQNPLTYTFKGTIW